MKIKYKYVNFEFSKYNLVLSAVPRPHMQREFVKMYSFIEQEPSRSRPKTLKTLLKRVITEFMLGCRMLKHLKLLVNTNKCTHLVLKFIIEGGKIKKLCPRKCRLPFKLSNNNFF